MLYRFKLGASCAVLLLAGCAEIQAPSGPSLGGATSGPGSPAIQQLVEEQPHSGNAGWGAATIVGAKGDGKPSIQRGGPASNSIGNAPRSVNGVPLIQPNNKGGA